MVLPPLFIRVIKSSEYPGVFGCTLLSIEQTTILAQTLSECDVTFERYRRCVVRIMAEVQSTVVFL